MNAAELVSAPAGPHSRLHLFVPLLVVLLFHTTAALAAESAPADNPSMAAKAVNALGIELLRKSTAPGANALLSPYSIQSALAMTYAGADGQTKAEMARTLHYDSDEQHLHGSFSALQGSLEAVAKTTTEAAQKAKQQGGPTEPVILTVANRLFGQSGYDFRPPFLQLAKETYQAPLQPLDFARDPSAARQQINHWVEDQTRQRIRELVPPDGIDKETRMVLVNAVYLKAPWAAEFPASATKPAPFYVTGSKPEQVPTMCRDGTFGYENREGFAVVTVPYFGSEVQFLILLPRERDGLAALEAKLTPALLAACAKPKSEHLVVYLPKFKVEPPLFRLSGALQALGMQSAFDRPKGSANFDRMAARRPDEYLYLSEVFHKTFIALDEKGTEAAAATAAVMARVASAVGPRPKPIEVRVEHPFIYAIQHRPSGACLFLGRLNDPR